MNKQTFSIWINSDEEKELQKLKKKALKKKRSLSNYCKSKLFGNTK